MNATKKQSRKMRLRPLLQDSRNAEFKLNKRMNGNDMLTAA